ncbi:hypothetical protein [Phenylobacterium sp.]|uniref:hypothetical protein n=1 Tax=Phenylobacterium sp. TaxID=1871053 RepID=UPI00391C068C
MSSTKDAPTATQLRLASARRRVRAFVDQISELEASDFPHKDGLEALGFIRKELEYQLNDFLGALPDHLSDLVVDEICAEVSFTVSRYTDILGFILRSTNVRNAFEVQFPLKRLVEQVVSSDARLIMSSEWNFVPFTYPMTLDLLPDFVLVGVPAPESGNVLLFPLAGHEIGHSAWRKNDFKTVLQAPVTRAVVRAIDADPEARARVLANLERSGQGLEALQNTALLMALKQLEEIFCDFFGLYVFGASYAYAYEYFLAPGGGSRSPFYPSSTDRIGYLLASAKAVGLSIEPELFGRWGQSSPRPGVDPDVLAFSDAAVAEVFPELVALALKLLHERQVPVPRSEAVDRVIAAFTQRVPDDDGATFPEIVTAGWRYLRSRGGLSMEADRAEYEMLGELMLKSIEVAEFRARIAHA